MLEQLIVAVAVLAFTGAIALVRLQAPAIKHES